MALTGWKYKKQITIDNTKINEDLTDFPVLVKLDSSNFDFTKAKVDGSDIRFTADDDITLLSYERERHDSANQEAEYWVKISSVSSSADTTFYMYYGNSSASDGSNPTNVWDNHYKAVYHLNETGTDTRKDSTANGNDGTPENGVAGANGQIAGANSFDGSNDYIKMGNWLSDINSAGKITFEYYENTTSTNDQTLWSTNNLTGANTLLISLRNLQYWDNNGNASHANLNSDYSDGNFHYIIAIIDTSASTRAYYEDGSSIGSGSFASGSSISNSSDMSLGKRSGDSYYVNGLIDEVRVSDTVRSDAWIKASYNSNNNSLLAVGAEQQIQNVIFYSFNF